MAYSARVVEELRAKYYQAQEELVQLQGETIDAVRSFDHRSRTREHLVFGVARRAGFVRRALFNVFSLFPPETETALDLDVLTDVAINLHAFLMHLTGIWDNWAWAYLLHHGREDLTRKRVEVGLFKPSIQQVLPKPVREWLQSERVRQWRKQHAAENRDALAHRIPPYVPPGQTTLEETAGLSRDLAELTARGEHREALDRLLESASSFSPCFMFVHAFTEDEGASSIWLHPQMVFDSLFIAEFGRLFLRHWIEPPATDASS